MDRPALTTYHCAECGLAVLVVGQAQIRGCPHKDAAILASVAATVRGKSTAATEQPDGER